MANAPASLWESQKQGNGTDRDTGAEGEEREGRRNKRKEMICTEKEMREKWDKDKEEREKKRKEKGGRKIEERVSQREGNV